MKFTVKATMFAIAAGALSLGAWAQAPQTTGNTNTPVIDQRQENQQQRIGEGVENGSLTAGEASHLEKKEAALGKEEQKMKADGNMTPAERQRLRNQENHLSNQIYRDKHNARVQNMNPKSEVGERQRMQQQRIGEGIENGSLTAGEASRLEHQEAGINREIHNDRAANGGKLTAQEKAQINHQQNVESKKIYNKKHNGKHRS